MDRGGTHNFRHVQTVIALGALVLVVGPSAANAQSGSCTDNTAVTYQFPAKAATTPNGSFWYVSNDHDTQSRDVNLKRWTGSKYTRLKPGAPAGSNVNTDWLIYGTPIYAMADGEVIACWRNAPDNPDADTPHQARDGCDGSCDQNARCSCTIPHSGNFIAIRTASGEILHHAHFRPGTVPSSLCPHNGQFVADANGPKIHEGAFYDDIYIPPGQRPQVKKGQFIGKAGHSGASSNPHLHVHRKAAVACDGAVPLRLTGAGYQNTGGGAPGNVWKYLHKEPLSTEGTNIIYKASEPFPVGLGEIARHGLPIKDYQFVFDKAVASKYEPVWLDMFDAGGKTYVNVIFRPQAPGKLRAFHGLNGSQYQTAFDTWVRNGYRPVIVESYIDNGVRYAVVFKKNSGPAFVAYHGLTAQQHQARFNDLKAKGFRPVAISVVSSGGRRYTGLYEKKNVGSWQLKSALTPAQYQAAYDSNKSAGRHVAYLNGYTHNGSAFISAIFTSATPAGGKQRHGMTHAKYQQEWQSAINAGMKTRIVTGYASGNVRTYAASWRQ